MGAASTTNMVEINHLPMPLYLLIASIANLTFLGRSILDNLGAAESKVAVNRFLLFMASAELCWVVPCFVQCFIVFVKGTKGDWSPDEEDSGCDVQGFYSVFSATVGQLMGLLAGWLTLQASRSRPISSELVTGLCSAIFAGSLIISSIPFMGAGEFKYSGEGFCYFDWHDTTHLVLTLIISLVSLVGGVTFFVLAAIGDPTNRLVILLFPLAFLFGWCLWPIAASIGLSTSSIPDHMLITGAILGHMQALINPALYGLVWREMFARESDGCDGTPAGTKLVEPEKIDPMNDSSASKEIPEIHTIDVVSKSVV